MADNFFDENDIAPESEDSFFDENDLHANEATSTPEISKFESLRRGTEQGATFGLYDELAGLTEAGGQAIGLEGLGGSIKDVGFTNPKLADLEALKEAYRTRRDTERSETKAAEEANPKTAFAGNLAGGFAIPIGALGKIPEGASAAQKVLGAMKIGGKAGAISGAGMSEADLTQPSIENVGEFAGDVAQGTAVGGALGGTLEGGGQLLSGIGQGIAYPFRRIKEVASETPIIQDFMESLKRGREGQKVSGAKVFEQTGQEAIDTAKSSGRALSSEGKRLAALQSEILKKSGHKFNFSDLSDMLKTGADSIPSVGTYAKADKKEIAQIADDLVQNFKLKELDAEQANKLKTTLAGFEGMNPRADVQQIKTAEGEKVISGARKKVTEDMYEKMPEFKEINDVISNYNLSMEDLGLDKVNQRFQDAKEAKSIKKTVFDIIKGVGRETDQSILARDSIKNLENTLNQTNPELAKQIIPKLSDVATRLDLAKKSTGSGSLIGNLLSIGGQAITAGNELGLAQKALNDATPETLKLIGSKAKAMGQAGSELANILYKAADADKQRKQAMIFGIMQNPVYRKILTGGQQEDERSK